MLSVPMLITTSATSKHFPQLFFFFFYYYFLPHIETFPPPLPFTQSIPCQHLLNTQYWIPLKFSFEVFRRPTLNGVPLTPWPGCTSLNKIFHRCLLWLSRLVELQICPHSASPPKGYCCSPSLAVLWLLTFLSPCKPRGWRTRTRAGLGTKSRLFVQ